MDNCPTQPGGDLPDSDGDGRADLCDCNAGDPNVFAVPAEVTGVRFGPGPPHTLS